MSFPDGSAGRICLPMQETWIWSLDHPLEEEMATHSSILAWKIPDRVTWWLQFIGSHRVRHVWVTEHTWRHSSDNTNSILFWNEPSYMAPGFYNLKTSHKFTKDFKWCWKLFWSFWSIKLASTLRKQHQKTFI